jgi:Zn-dependent protease with chaperone function
MAAVRAQDAAPHAHGDSAAMGAAPGESLAAAPADSAWAAARDSARTADSLAALPPPRDPLAVARAGFTEENRAYQRIRVTLRVVQPLFAIAVALALLCSGLSARFRDVAHRVGRNAWSRMLVFVSLVMLATTALGLPLAWYGGWAVERQFGFATHGPGAWLLDHLKEQIATLVAVGIVPLLAVAWAAIRRFRRTWWVWLAAGTLPVTLAGVLLQPLVFEPLFNRFTPLEDASLRAEILALGARAGIPARQVLQADMSRQTSKVNAYVSGFGATQRIVLWDTTLEKLERDEILFVMGHEMGHYVLGHIWKGVALSTLGAFAAFGLIALAAGAVLRRYGDAWGVRDVGDLASLPLLLALLTAVQFAAQPVTHAVSRAMEHESDVYGLEITHDNDAAARAFVKLAGNNRSDPDPPGWVRTWFYTHPPLGERILFALNYRPWESGRPARLFRERVAR